MATTSDTQATSPAQRGGVADDTLAALANLNRMRASPRHSPLSDRGVSPGRSFHVESPKQKDEGRSFFVPESPRAQTPRSRTQSPRSVVHPSPLREEPVRRQVNEHNVHSDIPHVSERKYDKDTMLAYLARHNHKHFTISTPYDEVRAAYVGIHDAVMLNNAKDNMRKLLLSMVRLIEWGNGKVDPFGVDLDGWTEYSYTTVDQYDVALEQLYEQYKGKFKMSPWGQLFMVMAMSAFWFSFTKTFTTPPGGATGGGNVMNTMMKIMMNPPPGTNPLSGVPAEDKPYSHEPSVPLQPPPQRGPPPAVHSPREAAASSEPPQLPPDIASMMSGMLNSPFMANLMRQAQ
jgi:hypothetical protein